MKKIIIFSIMMLMIALTGCKNDNGTEPISDPNYTGQYQSVPYDNSDSDPTVILLLDQVGNKIDGTGSWNGIAFSFTGTIIDKHVLIKFGLPQTNVGDLEGALDTYVGTDASLAGGYNLYNNSVILSGAIRFRKVKL